MVAAAAALFHLYVAGISPLTALVQRPVHLAFMAALGFLGVGIRSGEPSREGRPRRRLSSLVSWTLGSTVVASCIYLVTQHEVLVLRSGSPTTLDLITGIVIIVVILELARRFTGWGLVVVCLMALVYAISGPYLPGALAHRGYGVTRLVEHLYLSTEGVWGIPLGVSADFVYLFVLFGAVLDVAGGGALLISLADRVAGRTRGGPAKTAAVASALMGSLSGSAVANVATTGTFTIPLMRRAGFKPFFAGAIEAAASTGGQLMRPIMGAGAFILATWTSIPYTHVALAAAIPAALYWVNSRGRRNTSGKRRSCDGGKQAPTVGSSFASADGFTRSSPVGAPGASAEVLGRSCSRAVERGVGGGSRRVSRCWGALVSPMWWHATFQSSSSVGALPIVRRARRDCGSSSPRLWRT